MRYLIDTHIFLWWLNGDKKISDSLQRILENPQIQIYVSVATLWEISIKHALGKLPLKTTLSEMISVSGFELLSITGVHVLELEKLPLLHNDPFDRMLIAQTKAEHFIFITVDAKIRRYDIRIL
jgi:PIN domain nuclease of toxin-antitoxin system